MTARSWRRKAIALAAALAAGALFAIATPSPASADALRPINVTLTCSLDYGVGLPYGYQITTGSGLYYPPAQSDATVVGNAKTFHLYMPTSATSLGVNTWCNGFIQTAVWQGYLYNVVPGTSTLNAVGNCNTYNYSYYGYSTYLTYCTLTSITYS
jgi:hypothetical protein